MMVVARIKNYSASLVQDLEMRNMKLANYPWLKSRDDIRNKLLIRVTVLEKKEDVGILLRE